MSEFLLKWVALVLLGIAAVFTVMWLGLTFWAKVPADFLLPWIQHAALAGIGVTIIAVLIDAALRTSKLTRHS